MTNCRYFSVPPLYSGLNIKVGLLGGSFDPPHHGHLELSKIAIKQLGLQHVWWLVTAQNPLKKKPHNQLGERIKQCLDITKGNYRIKITDLENKINSNYTYQTIRYLTKRYRRIKFYLIIGADNLRIFTRWKYWEQLIKMVTIIVMDRNNSKYYKSTIDRYKKYYIHSLKQIPSWYFMNIKNIGISSTKLRSRVKSITES